MRKVTDLKETFEYLEEVEVSDDNINWTKARFGCLFPDGNRFEYKVICFDKKSASLGWKYIRKISAEKQKAIETIKELMSVNNIKIDEIG